MKKISTLISTLAGFIMAGVIFAAPSDASIPRTDAFVYPVHVSGSIHAGFRQKWSDGHITKDGSLASLYRECGSDQFCQGAWYGEYHKLSDWVHFQNHQFPRRPCQEEDSKGPCFWDAGTQGDGHGHSYWVDVLQCVHYLDPRIKGYCTH